jgi:hypothetical protein
MFGKSMVEENEKEKKCNGKKVALTPNRILVDSLRDHSE